MFTLKGHSLGAGVAVLVALKLRPKYPDLRVYAFSMPGTSFLRHGRFNLFHFLYTYTI